MGYSFMSIEKIKSAGTLNSKYKHNRRLVDVENADPDLADLNETLVPLGTSDGEELSYNDALKERLSSLPYYQSHKIRKDQVLGYEVLLSYSRDDNVDVEKWKMQSLKWLQDTFNVAGDGKANVLNVEFHGDETGNVHIHAFVVPIDERGHLNAKRFTNGVRALTDLQTSYAASVADLGLKRGLAGSSAKHKTIRKMYADLNNAINIPEVRPRESAEEYRRRILDDCETMYAARKKEADDYAVSTRRNTDRYVIQQREALTDECERIRGSATRELLKMKAERDKVQAETMGAKEEYDEYQQQLSELIQQMYEFQSAKFVQREKEKRAKRQEEIEKGLQVIAFEEPNRAKIIWDNMEEARSRASEWEKLYARKEPEPISEDSSLR